MTGTPPPSPQATAGGKTVFKPPVFKPPKPTMGAIAQVSDTKWQPFTGGKPNVAYDALESTPPHGGIPRSPKPRLPPELKK